MISSLSKPFSTRINKLIIHFSNHFDNLAKVRNTPLLARLLILIFEAPSTFVLNNDILFRLVGAIIQPPCDSNSLLRLGQMLSATLSPNSDPNEGKYPFHIAELEALLLQTPTGTAIDGYLYAIYIRNRLLNMLSILLAHSSGSINIQLCELIVQTLGFGWILGYCGQGVHPGTVFLALKILINIIKYPTLMAKFKEGSSNSGWLTDADSVIRNRAAVRRKIITKKRVFRYCWVSRCRRMVAQ